MEKTFNYQELKQELLALTDEIPYETANLANASALLWQTLPGINWAGFYRLDGDKLVLGPFQGKPACILIPVGRGVCGTAAKEAKTQRIADVHAFPGHIACDSASNSEIVIPLFVRGQLWGVLDIDSPALSRFRAEDEAGLRQIAAVLNDMLTNTNEKT